MSLWLFCYRCSEYLALTSAITQVCRRTDSVFVFRLKVTSHLSSPWCNNWSSASTGRSCWSAQSQFSSLHWTETICHNYWADWPFKCPAPWGACHSNRNDFPTSVWTLRRDALGLLSLSSEPLGSLAERRDVLRRGSCFIKLFNPVFFSSVGLTSSAWESHPSFALGCTLELWQRRVSKYGDIQLFHTLPSWQSKHFNTSSHVS